MVGHHPGYARLGNGLLARFSRFVSSDLLRLIAFSGGGFSWGVANQAYTWRTNGATDDVARSCAAARMTGDLKRGAPGRFHKTFILRRADNLGSQ